MSIRFLSDESVDGNVSLPDNKKLILGTGSDLNIFHDGSNSYFENKVGDLIIRQEADDKDIIFKSDNGSGGDTQYYRIDGGANLNVFSKDIFLADSKQALFGSNSDLRIYHNGTNSNIENFTGTLQIIQNADDGDISFQADDGSGGTTEYFRLDGSLVNGSAVLGATRFPDKSKIYMGTGGDLEIFHDGNNSYITQQGTGDLTIQQNVDDADIRFQSDDGSGGIAEYFRVDGGITKTVFVRDTKHLDNKKALFGDQDDLQIYHSGSHSYITDTGTGSLYLQTNGSAIYLQDTDGNAMAQFTDGGGSFLFYNGNLKLSTTNTGVSVTGGISLSGDISASTGDLALLSSSGEYILYGATDAQTNLYHNGIKKFETTSTGIAITGNIDSPTISINDYITHNGDTDTYFGFPTANEFKLVAGGSNKFSADANAAYMYYQGNAKLQTTNTGVSVTGGWVTDGVSVAQANIEHTDNTKSLFGNGNDLQIYHDGSNSYIKDSGTGNLIVNATNFVVNNSADTQNMIIAVDGGATTLFCAGVGRIATTSTGVSIVGNIDLTSSSSDIDMIDNGAAALEIKQGSDLYMRFVTTNGGEEIQVNKDIQISAGFNANSATFGGTVSAEDNIHLTDAGTVRAKLLLNASDRDNVELRAESLGSTMKFFTAGTEALELDASQNATFAGDVTVGDSGNINIPTSGAGNANLNFNGTDFKITSNSSSANLKLETSSTTRLTINSSGNATFAGNLTVGSNNITGAQFYVQGTYPRIYLSDTDSNDDYSIINDNGTFIVYNDTDSSTAFSIAGNNNATFAGDVTVSGGDITLGGTGRIQGIDTVSAGTDAANKTYVDNAVAGGGSGTVTSVGFSHQGNAFTTGGAPVTSNGTISITMAGTSSQYIDGAGDLTTFPSIPQGDITEVIAGNKLTGGGTSGSVTLGLASNNISQFTNDSGYTTNTGTMSSWIISSDSGAATITNGATMKIAGGTNISTAESSGVVTITNGVTNNNQLTNGAGYTTNTGDITNVSTTAPIIGGGASGSVTIEHAASGAVPGSYPNADITVDATGHITAVASGAPGFISAANSPANFGFQSPEVPDNTGLFAAGWIIINIGGQNYYIPAWTP